MNLVRLWKSRNLNVVGICARNRIWCQLLMIRRVCIICVPRTAYVSISVSVSVIVSVPSSLADYQWNLISNSQYVVSLEKSKQDSYDSKWTFQSVSSTGNHRRPVNPKQPKETQATRQAVNPE